MHGIFKLACAGLVGLVLSLGAPVAPAFAAPEVKEAATASGSTFAPWDTVPA